MGTGGRVIPSSLLLPPPLVCGIKHSIKDGKPDEEKEVIPIAGNLADWGGGSLDHVATRLKTSESHADSQKEGLRLVLKGGRYPLTGPPSGRESQRAILELICDRGRDGTEGEWTPSDQYEGAAATQQPFSFLSRRDDHDKEGDKEGDGEDGGDGKTPPPAPPTSEEKQLKKDDAALVWNSFKNEDLNGELGRVLRLTWYTKYACEDRADDPDEPSKHWGFFTWLVVM